MRRELASLSWKAREAVWEGRIAKLEEALRKARPDVDFVRLFHKHQSSAPFMRAQEEKLARLDALLDAKGRDDDD